MNDNMSDNDSVFKYALRAVPQTPELLARELRAMASGKGEFRHFIYVTPWIKNIWRAAADVIEKNSRAQR